MAVSRRHRVGLLGGSFNPVHLGHLIIAQDAYEQARLDEVWFIPCHRPPHKSARDLAAAAHRWVMLCKALAGDSRFVPLDLELRRGGISYSVDTLEELRRIYPTTQFYFIIGADGVADLPRWKDAERLMQMCQFLVMERPGFVIEGAWASRCRVIRGHHCNISSHDIRARLRAGKSIRYLVPDSVFRYIRLRKLYR
ncbi:MAG: nicotinate-nucleotide adenylyltransferase [Verrucomicrobiae bacterium]|nr:nicotinate-nucleotide adenylyltransferase [Verrucomicrobiae bacterium]